MNETAEQNRRRCERCSGTGVIKSRVPMDPIGPWGDDAIHTRKCRECDGQGTYKENP
jgi:DnaJ-class molecular chaperone